MSLDNKYFVLNPKSKCLSDQYAFASREAMRAYATTIEKTNPKIAAQLRTWAQKEQYDEVRKFTLPDHPNTKVPEPTSTPTTLLTAPWPDFLGNPIHEGDKIKRSDGWAGTVFVRKHVMNVSKRWFVSYGGACPLLNLLNEIGDESQGIVIPNDDPQPEETE